MTPADLIEVLREANAAEVAEIRRLLGVPTVPNRLETMFVGPGQDNYGRGWYEASSRLAGLLREAQPPEPEPLEPRDSTQRGRA